jgi:pumilio family protein 6
VISESFELYASPTDKARLLREFYGKEVTLFEPDKGIRSGLHGVLEGLDEERKKRILGALKENLQKMSVFPG